MSLKEYYRPDEVMEILDIKKATFYRYVHRVEDPLPAIRIGGTGPLRVKIVSLEEWISKNKIDTAGLNNG